MNSLKNISKLWLFALLCLGVSGYKLYDFYFNTYLINQEKSADLTNEIELKKNQLARILAQNQRMGALEEEIRAATLEFQQLKEMFPDKDFLPKKLQDFTKACRIAGVTPVHFKPSHILEKDFYIENFYDIQIHSGFHGLGRFLAEIANFKYPTGITGVTVHQKLRSNTNPDQLEENQESHSIITSFQFKTFTSKR